MTSYSIHAFKWPGYQHYENIANGMYAAIKIYHLVHKRTVPYEDLANARLSLLTTSTVHVYICEVELAAYNSHMN